jgi:ferritin
MLKQDVKKLLNEQINKEFYSAYLYLYIAGYYAAKNLNGFENWFLVQAREEQDHAMLIRQYLINEGEEAALTAIDAPRDAFDSFRAPLTAALKHEQFVTESIYAIYAQAQKEGDFRTVNFLNWFVNEQGEEEKNADELIKRYDLFGADPKGLYMLNADLAARTYTPPSLVLS